MDKDKAVKLLSELTTQNMMNTQDAMRRRSGVTKSGYRKEEKLVSEIYLGLTGTKITKSELDKVMGSSEETK